MKRMSRQKIMFELNRFELYRFELNLFELNMLTFVVGSKTGVPNLGYARGLKAVFTWVHLYQWGDAIDVKGTQIQKGWEPLV
jgi:hypothetical protein